MCISNIRINIHYLITIYINILKFLKTTAKLLKIQKYIVNDDKNFWRTIEQKREMKKKKSLIMRVRLSFPLYI